MTKEIKPHYHHFIHPGEDFNGFTLCTLDWPDGRVAVGVAFCSANDNFSRKIGRELSYVRAMTKPIRFLDGQFREHIQMWRYFVEEDWLSRQEVERMITAQWAIDVVIGIAAQRRNKQQLYAFEKTFGPEYNRSLKDFEAYMS